MGTHSKIPFCCINFFLERWDPENWNMQKKHTVRNVHYVPCEKCLTKKSFIKTKDCNVECLDKCKYVNYARRNVQLNLTVKEKFTLYCYNTYFKTI